MPEKSLILQSGCACLPNNHCILELIKCFYAQNASNKWVSGQSLRNQDQRYTLLHFALKISLQKYPSQPENYILEKKYILDRVRLKYHL